MIKMPLMDIFVLMISSRLGIQSGFVCKSNAAGKKDRANTLGRLAQLPRGVAPGENADGDASRAHDKLLYGTRTLFPITANERE